MTQTEQLTTADLTSYLVLVGIGATLILTAPFFTSVEFFLLLTILGLSFVLGGFVTCVLKIIESLGSWSDDDS